MSANNIVKGPWGNLPPSPTDKIEGEKVQSDFLFIMNHVMNHMETRGIDTLDEAEYIKDLALIAESIRSYLYKIRNRYHPNQDVAENLFYWTPEGLRMNTSLIVEFK